MPGKKRPTVDCRKLELDGIRYVVVRESLFEWLCQRARIQCGRAPSQEEPLAPALDLDRASLAEKLVRRRAAAGLSQVELARRAGVRPETLNRIERARTTPDFATVRKLVVAITAAEQEKLTRSLPAHTHKEPCHADRG